MTSQLPGFRCLFLSYQLQKKTPKIPRLYVGYSETPFLESKGLENFCIVKISKGLVQLDSRLYSGWGFLPSQ